MHSRCAHPCAVHKLHCIICGSEGGAAFTFSLLRLNVNNKVKKSTQGLGGGAGITLAWHAWSSGFNA